MKIFATAALSIFLLIFVVLVSAADKPDAGQHTRGVKALSDQEIADYLQEPGTGLSKVADPLTPDEHHPAQHRGK
jgi:hypothetical protein